MNDFIEILINETQNKLGDHFFLEPVTSIKNNNQIYHGIQVRKEDSSMCPVFYVGRIYEDYQNGILSLSDCAELLIRQINKPNDFSIDPSFYSKYENIKDRVNVMLVNYDANKEQLKEKPHFCLLDLAATFYVGIAIDNNTMGVLHITNKLLKEWGIDSDTFVKVHLNVMLTRSHAVLCDIEDVIALLSEKLGEELPEGFDDNFGKLKGHLYVLTNAEGRYGANMLLNTAILHQFATSHDDNLVIYPSSVHEALVTFKSDRYTNLITARHIAEVNLQMVSPEERLSNNVYLYDRHQKRLSILSKGFSLAELEAMNYMVN